MNHADGGMSHWMGGYTWGWPVQALMGLVLLVFVILKITKKQGPQYENDSDHPHP